MSYPETICKQALKDLLDDTFAADVAAEDLVVSYGPPSADVAVPAAVWLGRVETDVDDGANTGSGIATNVDIVVDVNLDVYTRDDRDTGAVAVEQEAAGLGARVRQAVRDAAGENRASGGDHVLTVPAGWRALLWRRVLQSTSDGPLRVDGGGWVCTVVMSVQFHARSA